MEDIFEVIHNEFIESEDYYSFLKERDLHILSQLEDSDIYNYEKDN